MESANLHLHQHQLQDQLVGSSSSSLASPSFYAASSNHVWTPNIHLNSGNFSSNLNGEILRDSRQENESSSIIQNLGFPWTHNNANSIHKFSGVEDFHPHSTTYTKDKDLNDMREKLLLKTISSGFDKISGQNQFYSNAQISRGSFSQIYPSINISNLSQSSDQASSSSMDMNLQALDLLTSARFSGSFSHHQATHHDHNLDMFQDSLSFGLDHMRQSTHKPSCSPSQISSPFSNGVTEVKRPSSLIGLQPKASQAAPKKSRLESRASCPPFKVRKEKLGDRIAALQQLVAPFGKTDTASVLMEAIGYIKFLQNQVETLSVPYMKSSRNKSSRSIQGALTKEDGDEESKQDLKSRGLCLVPLSCMSYVTNDSGGGGLWPPPNFGGGT